MPGDQLKVDLRDRCIGYNKSDKVLQLITQQFSENFENFKEELNNGYQKT